MEAFAQAVKASMQAAYPDFRIELKDVLKNNSLHLTALCMISGESNVSPAVYLDSFYQKYQETHDFLQICLDIKSLYEKERPHDGFSSECLTDYRWIRDHICYRLINRAKNEKILRDTPYISYLDLAIVFFIPVNIKAGRADCINVKNALMQEWGVADASELYKEAHRNTCRIFKGQIDSMMDIFREASGRKEEISPDTFAGLIDAEAACSNRPSMFIASNSERLYGASAILYEGLLKSFSEAIKDDLIILPSSVHETILVPVSAVSNPDFFREMVVEINKTVAVDEVLSDNIYYYDHGLDRVNLI